MASVTAHGEPLTRGVLAQEGPSGCARTFQADPVCKECGRLREQARAALLSGDRSRLSDVRVFQGRHRALSHGQQIPATSRRGAEQEGTTDG